jgi:hypothetical protein
LVISTVLPNDFHPRGALAEKVDCERLRVAGLHRKPVRRHGKRSSDAWPVKFTAPNPALENQSRSRASVRHSEEPPAGRRRLQAHYAELGGQLPLALGGALRKLNGISKRLLRHRSLPVMRRYIRGAYLFDDNAAAAVGL